MMMTMMMMMMMTALFCPSKQENAIAHTLLPRTQLSNKSCRSPPSLPLASAHSLPAIDPLPSARCLPRHRPPAQLLPPRASPRNTCASPQHVCATPSTAASEDPNPRVSPRDTCSSARQVFAMGAVAKCVATILT